MRAPILHATASQRSIQHDIAGGLEMKIKLEADDCEAVLNLVDVLVGRKSAGVQFVDRRDRTRLAPYY